jgi:hypothetical protein
MIITFKNCIYFQNNKTNEGERERERDAKIIGEDQNQAKIILA